MLLGKAIALRLAKDGHHVGLNDLPSKKAVLEEVAHQVEQHGVRAGVFTGDVTKENDVRATIDGAADALGGLHVVSSFIVYIARSADRRYVPRWSRTLDCT